MDEIRGDLWEVASEHDAICITTNGFVGRRNQAIMGAGCAKEAKERYPGIDLQIGKAIKTYGNIPWIIFHNVISDFAMATFPTKHNWYERSDLGLIKASAIHLVKLADSWKWGSIVIPRPGCGCGGLDWAKVRDTLDPILDDRFHAITRS